MRQIIIGLVFFVQLFSIFSCRNKPLPNQGMIDLLKQSEKYEYNAENIYCPEAIIKFNDSILDVSSAEADLAKARYDKANALLQLGEEQKAIDIYEYLLGKT